MPFLLLALAIINEHFGNLACDLFTHMGLRMPKDSYAIEIKITKFLFLTKNLPL